MHSVARRLADLPAAPDLDVAIDTRAAMVLLERAVIEHANPHAIHTLAKLLSDTHSSVPRDIPRAIHLYKIFITESNHPAAMYDLATLMASLSNSRDVAYAAQLLQRCIEQYDNVDAMIDLAAMLTRGATGVLVDAARAADLYHEIYQSCNDYSALFLLAKINAAGAANLPPNVPLAVELFQRCVQERDNPDAMIALANLWIDGAPGVAMDVDRALEMCRMRIDQDPNCDCVLEIARRYISDSSGRRKDVDLATRLLTLCVDRRNNPHAMMDLVQILLVRGRPKHNVDRAVELCHKFVAAGGSCERIAYLATDIACANCNLQQDRALAIRLFEMGIEKKCRESYQGLCMLLISGAAPSEKNLTRMLSLCGRSIEHCGDCTAVLHIAKEVQRGSENTFYVVPDAPLALTLYYLCMDKKKSADAMVCAADLLISGAPDLPVDVNSGVKWLRKSVKEDESRRYDRHIIKRIAARRYYGLAVELLEESIEHWDDAEAKIELARMLMTGVHGLDRDLKRGVRLCESSWSSGSCSVLLTTLMEDVAYGSRGLHRDASLAIRMLDACVERTNDRNAMFKLVELVVSDLEGVERDVAKCLKLCEKLVETHGDCFINTVIYLAERISKGTGNLVQDKPLAISIYQMCIDKRRNAKAMVQLAELLLSDDESGRDFKRAKQLCEMSIDTGECRHVRVFARQIVDGAWGVVQDVEMGMALLEKCIEHNDTEAMLQLARMLLVYGEQRDVPRAIKLCERYVWEVTDCYGVRKLAGLIRQGREGITEDAVLAKQLLEMCVAGRGCCYAMVDLADLLVDGADDVPIDVERACDLYWCAEFNECRRRVFRADGTGGAELV